MHEDRVYSSAGMCDMCKWVNSVNSGAGEVELACSIAEGMVNMLVMFLYTYLP